MNRFVKLAWSLALVLVTVVLLAVVFRVERHMDQVVKDEHLRFGGSVQDASPLVSFTTVALGSFRGLLADMLWIRAAKLQENNNFFEMVQLARWMTDLQPEFSGAAAYLAWNMAYNISVSCSFHEDRWRWVNEGIKLMRDRAIVYDPEDPARYKELGWIFLHKLGNILDPSQQYYKNQLALDMMKVVTPNPDWERIADAPKTLEEFEKRDDPAGRVPKAVAEAGYEDFDKFYDVFKETGDIPTNVAEKLADPKLLENLDFYLRRRALVEKYKLDPAVIVEINKRYGKLDWRLPEAQSIYWATMGIKKTPKGVSPTECDRIITQSLPEAFRAGRLVYIDTKDHTRIMIAPNLELIDTALKAFDDADARAEEGTFTQGRRSFVKYATTTLYSFGKKAKAEKYFRMAKKLDPGIPRDMTLDAFVRREMDEDLNMLSQKRLMALLSGLLFQSFDCRISGDGEGADSNELMAQYIYAKFQKENKNVDRVLLPAFSKIRTALLEEYAKSVKPAYAKVLNDYYAKALPEKKTEVQGADAAVLKTEKKEKK